MKVRVFVEYDMETSDVEKAWDDINEMVSRTTGEDGVYDARVTDTLTADDLAGSIAIERSSEPL